MLQQTGLQKSYSGDQRDLNEGKKCKSFAFMHSCFSKIMWQTNQDVIKVLAESGEKTVFEHFLILSTTWDFIESEVYKRLHN